MIRPIMGTIEGHGRKYVHGSESAINYIPDDPDIKIKLAFLGKEKRFDPYGVNYRDKSCCNFQSSRAHYRDRIYVLFTCININLRFS